MLFTCSFQENFSAVLSAISDSITTLDLRVSKFRMEQKKSVDKETHTRVDPYSDRVICSEFGEMATQLATEMASHHW